MSAASSGASGGPLRSTRTDEIEGVQPADLNAPRSPRSLQEASGRESERVERDDAVPQGLGSPAGRDREVLALRVRHQDGAGVVEEVRDDGADPLPGPRGGDGQDVARPVVAQERTRPGPPSPLLPTQDEPALGPEGAPVVPLGCPVAPRGPERAGRRERGDEPERDKAAERGRQNGDLDVRRIGARGPHGLRRPPGARVGAVERAEPDRRGDQRAECERGGSCTSPRYRESKRCQHGDRQPHADSDQNPALHRPQWRSQRGVEARPPRERGGGVEPSDGHRHDDEGDERERRAPRRA